jgi:deoxyribonuclease-4
VKNKRKSGAAKAAAKQPTARKPTAQKPAAKQATAKKPTGRKPTARKPTARTAAADRSAAKPAPRRPAGKPHAPPWAPTPGAEHDAAPLGAHVPIQGGTPTCFRRGAEIGASGLQVFTKTPNQWKEREVTAEERAAFAAARAEFPTRWVTAHDSYLINLASPDATLRARSLESFIAELRRCHALGLDALVSHPGNFIDDHDAGLARNADAIVAALEAAPGPTRLLLETTAGSGTALGRSFEELAAILARIPTPLQARVGVCADTCHLYSAGYDLVGDWDGVWARFDDALGLERLGCVHLNDSATPFASHKDRHALIGEGSLGPTPFRRLMTDPRLAHVPRMLETPKGDDLVTNDRRMLALLRGYARG